ncbi:MAG: hypothetical protein AB1898_31740 [Acidobacteriota bacterium]
MRRIGLLPSVLAGLAIVSLVLVPARQAATPADKDIELRVLGTYSSGFFDEGAAEISAYDPGTQRLFVVNAATSTIDVLDISNPTQPSLRFAIDVNPYGRQANSVAVYQGVLAAAVEAHTRTDPGQVVFFDADGNFLSSVFVGSLPDMLTFTPDGTKVLVANEGEPSDDYLIDPEGSVSIINLSGHSSPRTLQQSDVTHAGFQGFALGQLDPSIRIYGPGATPAQDLEPEYIAVSPDSRAAWVSLQENNALGILLRII